MLCRSQVTDRHTHTHTQIHAQTERERQRGTDTDRQTDTRHTHTHLPKLLPQLFRHVGLSIVSRPPPQKKGACVCEWAWMCVFVRARV